MSRHSKAHSGRRTSQLERKARKATYLSTLCGFNHTYPRLEHAEGLRAAIVSVPISCPQWATIASPSRRVTTRGDKSRLVTARRDAGRRGAWAWAGRGSRDWCGPTEADESKQQSCHAGQVQQRHAYACKHTPTNPNLAQNGENQSSSHAPALSLSRCRRTAPSPLPYNFAPPPRRCSWLCIPTAQVRSSVDSNSPAHSSLLAHCVVMGVYNSPVVLRKTSNVENVSVRPSAAESSSGKGARQSVAAAIIRGSSQRRRARANGPRAQRYVAEQAKRRKLAHTPPINISFPTPVPSSSTPKDVEMKDGTRPTSTTTVILPRHLSRPTFKPVPHSRVASIEPQLADLPIEYIQDKLAELGPEYVHRPLRDWATF